MGVQINPATAGATSGTTLTGSEGLTQQQVNPQLDLSAQLQGPPTPAPYGTKEILWFSVGKWGESGYAIWNSGGKNASGNSAILALVQNVGANLFELMHRPDVYQARPPQKQFLWDVYQMVWLVQKRINDMAIGYTGTPNQTRLDGEKSAPSNQQFLVYPIPYFGDRVQQPDVRLWAELVLLALSEMAQHDDNKYTNDITSVLAAKVNPFFNRILYAMATKYFGYTAQTYAAASSAPNPSASQAAQPATVNVQFQLQAQDWTNYDPTKLFLASEFTSTLPPIQWMPTDQDLANIRGLPYGTAIQFGQRWIANSASMYGTGGGANYTPGTGALRADGSSPINTHAGGTASPSLAGSGAASTIVGSFSAPPQ